MKYYLGIDLGGTNIAAGIIDEHYHFIAQHKRPTLADRPFADIMKDMADAALAVIAEAKLTLKDFDSIGLGVPSSINPVTRNVIFANNLGWWDTDVIGEFKKHIDIPVFIANDADCAALGEALAGAAKGYDCVLLLTLGTGVGGGVIMNGQIFNGGDHYGSELGHSTLVLDGFPCTCGRNGCLEAYASVTGLIRETIEAIAADPHTLMRALCENNIDKVNGRTAFTAAKQGDASGQKVVDRYIYYLANGISSFVSIFSPNAVILGGGVSNEGENLLVPVRKIVAETMYGAGVKEPPAILKAALGNEAGIIGAAVLETQTAL